VQPLVDSAGRRLQIVYPGRRAGTPGPDFRDAILATADGTLLRGDVELHVRAADWYAHRHDRDPAYGGVILHLIAIGPVRPVRSASGDLVPSALVQPAPHPAALPLGIVCPSSDLEAAAAAVDAAGDAWLADRALFLASQCDALGEDEAAWQALAEAMGYGGNRAGFRALAEAVPWAHLAGLLGRNDDAQERAAALLLGAAGLALAAEDLARWRALGAPAPLLPIPWVVAGIRPANRPEARIRALACLAVACRDAGPAAWLRWLAALRPAAAVAAIVAASAGALGADWARTILVNVALPLAASDHPAPAFSALPRLPENAITRSMSELVFTPAGRHLVSGARRQQGLLHLYRRWCRDKECAACPVAQRVAADERGSD
jgi:hypothetical protein